MKPQKIDPDIEYQILLTVRTNREVIKSLELVNQALMSQLPDKKGAQTARKGYIVDPKTGKKCWYDLKAKALAEKAAKGLKLVKGGNDGKSKTDNK